MMFINWQEIKMGYEEMQKAQAMGALQGQKCELTEMEQKAQAITFLSGLLTQGMFNLCEPQGPVPNVLLENEILSLHRYALERLKEHVS